MSPVKPKNLNPLGKLRVYRASCLAGFFLMFGLACSQTFATARVLQEITPFALSGLFVVIPAVLLCIHRPLEWLNRKLGCTNLALWTQVVVAAEAIALWRLAAEQSVWSSWVLYVWVEVAALVVLRQFWRVVKRNGTSQTQSTLVLSCGMTGCILGGLTAWGLAGLASELLLLAWCGASLITAGLFYAIRQREKSDDPVVDRTACVSRLTTGLRSNPPVCSKQTPRLLAPLAVLAVLSVLVTVFTDYCFKISTASVFAGDLTRLVAFLGTYHIALGGCCLVAAWLFHWRSPGGHGSWLGMYLTPMVVGLAALGFMMWPVLGMALIWKLAEAGVCRRIDQTSRASLSDGVSRTQPRPPSPLASSLVCGLMLGLLAWGVGDVIMGCLLVVSIGVAVWLLTLAWLRSRMPSEAHAEKPALERFSPLRIPQDVYQPAA